MSAVMVQTYDRGDERMLILFFLWLKVGNGVALLDSTGAADHTGLV